MATVNLFGDLALDDTVKATNNKLDDLISSRGETAAADQKGAVLFGIRRDADTSTIADGGLAGLALDEEGRLKTATKTASFGVTTGVLTAAGSILAVDVRRASNVVFHVKNTGTAAMAAGQFAFEASIDSTDGTNGTWFAIQAVRSNANTIEVASGVVSLAIGAGALYSWESSVNAYQFMRIRCTNVVTTNAAATWTVQRGTYATEPIPAAQVSTTQTISGTVTANWGTLTAGAAYSLTTAATTNAGAIKAGVGSIYELTISNPTATPAYVKFYNKSGAPVVGTDVPVLTIPVGAAGTDAAFVQLDFGTVGKRFTTGISIAATGAAVSSDTTAAVAGVQVSLTYI